MSTCTKVLRFSKAVTREVWGLLVHAMGHPEMNLPQPGTIKTKGRKEQTSALKDSWEAAKLVPPIHQLVLQTLVCMTRACNGTSTLMERYYFFIGKITWRFVIVSWYAKHPSQAIVLLLMYLEFFLQPLNPNIPFLVGLSVIFLANASPRPHIVYFFWHTISSHLKVLYTSLFLNRCTAAGSESLSPPTACP